MRAVRVVLADEGSGGRARALELSEGCGFEIVGEAVGWDGVAGLCATRGADLVLVAGGPDYAAGVGTLPPEVASVALVEDARAAKDFAGSGVGALVALDCDPDILTATSKIALVSARRFSEARAEIETLREALETRKLVERAKGVLMQRLGVTEDVAYRRMQRASQEENRRMADVADSILRAERFYSGPSEDPA